MLSASLAAGPAGLMLYTALSGEWKPWKEKRWQQHDIGASSRTFTHVDLAQSSPKQPVTTTMTGPLHSKLSGPILSSGLIMQLTEHSYLQSLLSGTM